MKPFHQVARYETVKNAIETMRSKEQHTILEVGAGSHGNLALYLPNDQITFLDMLLTEEAKRDPRFVLGDATNLLYPDAYFDFVIGLDVLEHIPPKKRSVFLHEVCRVAKHGVFLSFPQKESGCTGADETLRAIYLAVQSTPPVWIDEHIDCTLPDADEIEQTLSELIGNEHICRLYSIRRSLMQKMLCLEAVSSHYPGVARYFQVMNEQYIADILPYDIVCEEQRANKCLFLINRDRPAEEVRADFLARLHSNHEVLNLFEAELTSRLGWFMQLEGLTADENIRGAAEKNQKQVLQNFEVLNGQTQAAFGKLEEGLNDRHQQILQNFEVLNGQTQAAFGNLEEGLNDRHQQILQNFEVLNGQTQAAFGKLEEGLNDRNQQILQNFEVLNGQTQAAFGNLEEGLSNRHQQLFHDIDEINGQTQVSLGAMTEKLDDIRTTLHRIADDRIVLDVILITYNQSKYIEETVRSILSQRTKFRFRVLVADDCSKDDTVEKIQRLSEETDIPFVFLQCDHNLGIMKNYKRSFAACTAEFTAILEGDDIWVDPLRLQKHVEFLQQHSECSMSFNRYIVKNFEEGTFHTQPRFSAEDEQKPFRYISGHDLAYDNLIGNFSTSVYRTACLRALPDQLFDMKAYDWLTNILISKMGPIGCLMGVSSIYRIHANGVWSGQSRKEQLTDLVATIDEYNRYTGYEFSAGFSAHRERLLAELNALELQEKIEKITSEQTIVSEKQHIKKLLCEMIRVERYLPPIVIAVIRLLVPTVLQEKIRQKCSWG